MGSLQDDLVTPFFFSAECSKKLSRSCSINSEGFAIRRDSNEFLAAGIDEKVETIVLGQLRKEVV